MNKEELERKLRYFRLKGWVLEKRMEQYELEQRAIKSEHEWELYKAKLRGELIKQGRMDLLGRLLHKPEEHRSEEFETKHPRNKNGTFAAKGLTGSGESDIIITEEDRKAVDRTLKEHWYIFKNKRIAKIRPYHDDYMLTVKINGFRDFEIIDKKEHKPVGGE